MEADAPKPKRPAFARIDSVAPSSPADAAGQSLLPIQGTLLCTWTLASPMRVAFLAIASAWGQANAGCCTKEGYE